MATAGRAVRAGADTPNASSAPRDIQLVHTGESLGRRCGMGAEWVQNGCRIEGCGECHTQAADAYIRMLGITGGTHTCVSSLSLDSEAF